MTNKVEIEDNFGEAIKLNLCIVRRRVPLKIEFVPTKKGEYDPLKVQINGYRYFYRNFETRFTIRAGDVFMVKMMSSEGVGSELARAHYYAALLDSNENNPLIRVVPLKSFYEDRREPNPASDVVIGKLAGIHDDRESIAIINQTRVIDKMRLFNGSMIREFHKFIKTGLDYKKIKVHEKLIFRLSREQLEKIRKAVQEYDYNGYIHH